MSAGTPEVLARLRQRRRNVIQGFLWVLLGIVGLTMLINVGLRGADAFAPQVLIPNLAFGGIIAGSLWLNHRHRFHAALGLIAALILGITALQVVVAGVEGTVLLLFLFFIPTVLAGLLLDRRALFLTGGASLATVLATLYLQWAGLHPQALQDPVMARATTLQFAIVFTLVVFFLDRFGLSLNEALTTAAERDVALSHEVEERRRAEAEVRAANVRIARLNAALEERLTHLTSLREIDRAITGSLDLDLTLAVLLEQVTGRLGVDAADVLLYKGRSGTLNFAAGRGFRTTALRDATVPLGSGLAGRAAARRERIVIDDAAEILRSSVREPGIEDESIRSYLAVPLIARGQLQGVLELFHRSHLEPDGEWFELLDAFATQAAIALDNATLFEDLERSNDELRQAYDTTIAGWARALDQRDRETEGHSRRVTELTVALAERMDVSDEELVHVRRGSLLHDIGKMGIPDSILLKNDELDLEERRVMERHPSFAHELLAPIPFLRPALDIPYAHHEHWDGSGYPRGLEGEEIPLAARIFAVVDVFDALTSDRSYRAAWNQRRVLDHIREGAGTHFDPAVVTSFLEMMKDARQPDAEVADPIGTIQGRSLPAARADRDSSSLP